MAVRQTGKSVLVAITCTTGGSQTRGDCGMTRIGTVDSLGCLSGLVLLLTGAFSISLFFKWKLRYWLTGVFQQTKPRDTQKQESTDSSTLEKPTKLTIVFASQTGTAETFSRKLHSLLSARIPVTVIDVEELEPETLEKIATESGHWMVFCVATHGEGEPTDSARPFYKWVHNKKRSKDCLSGLRYAVMGLGNRQYALFNEAGKTLDKDLTRLGGISICSRGEGDDDGDIEVDFNLWMQAQLSPALGLTESFEMSLLETIPSCWTDTDIHPFVVGSQLGKAKFDAGPATSADVVGRFYFESYCAKVSQVLELRQNPVEGKTTKHIEIELSTAVPLRHSAKLIGAECTGSCFCKEGVGLSYASADTMEILPPQSDEAVAAIFERFIRCETPGTLSPNITLDSAISFDSASNPPKHLFPSGVTLRHVLRLFCDLVGCPSRAVIRNLGCFIKSKEERIKLAQLLSDENAEKFKKVVRKSMLNITEIIELLMPSAVFCETEQDFIAAILMLPRLAPRAYTISSSSEESPRMASITVSLVASRESASLKDVQKALEEIGCANNVDTSSSTRAFAGACSSYLCTKLKTTSTQSVGGLGIGGGSHPEQLIVRIVPSTFKLPMTGAPLVMVGAGSGIAPFRAFLREVAHLHRFGDLSPGINEGKGLPSSIVLFFGCTSSEDDFLYRDEIRGFLEPSEDRPPVIAHFFGAFSREQKRKIYVQDLVREKSSLMFDLLVQQRGAVLICGATTMGAGVKAALRTSLGRKQFDRLVSEKRLTEELWSS